MAQKDAMTMCAASPSHTYFLEKNDIEIGIY